jgi:hypothetical protein
MSEEYQLNDSFNLAINYRYVDDKIIHFTKLIEQPSEGRGYLKTEHDVITAWADFAKHALEGEDAESEIKCWKGHYDQFGMVMLNYANMCRYRKDYAGNWNSFFESALPTDCYDHLFEGPSGTEDRIYYRVWFALLGHPNFLTQTLLGMEALTYKSNELSLCIAFENFNSSLMELGKC